MLKYRGQDEIADVVFLASPHHIAVLGLLVGTSDGGARVVVESGENRVTYPADMVEVVKCIVPARPVVDNGAE